MTGCHGALRNRTLFGEDCGFQFFDPSSVFVELRLNDLIEAAIDGGKAVMPDFITFTTRRLRRSVQLLVLT
jgi:hypothetical protein